MTRAQTGISPDALDARIHGAIEAWRSTGATLDDETFDALALDLYGYQFQFNAPYRAFAESLGFDEARRPRSWLEIPAVPSTAFKDATLATFDISRAALEFHTSGTTAERAGKHYFESRELYDAALLAGFDRFVLADGIRLRYLSLVPNPGERPHSSLGYMMGHVDERRGDAGGRFFLQGDVADVAAFERALDEAVADEQPVCIAGTAFAFVAVLDALAALERRFRTPRNSRIMETGGFKGRSRTLERPELYARMTETFAIAPERIVAEYGMTELTSQYYDTLETRGDATRTKAGPPWLRTAVVDAFGQPVRAGEVGFLRHVDLANRASVLAIQTEDRGYACAGGFVLLGRDEGATLRGCSLDAEELQARGSAS